MKGTIKTITRNGTFNKMGKYDIEFNHTQGEKIMFFSTTEQTDENFPYVVGKEIDYEIKPNGNGKLIREDNFTKGFNQMPNKKVNTNDSILAQVCYKANMDVFGKDNNELVESHTTKDFNWMKKLIQNG